MVEVPIPVAEVELPTIELIYEDGIPLESNWHRIQINLLIALVYQAMRQRGHTNFFAGGNMFVYYELEQARDIAANPDTSRCYRGPDFFFVDNVPPKPDRKAWVVWEEGGRYPDLIVELLSPSTAESDKTTKKRLYEQVFHTAEYYWYDPEVDELRGWRLRDGRYVEIAPNEQGWLWSEVLQLWLGRWEGKRLDVEAIWLRFYDADGNLVPTSSEAERQRAEAERRRAEAAEAELERLRRRLVELGIDPDTL